MPFLQIASTTILATGTEGSLDGIEGIPGVTRIDNGLFSTYDLGNFSIVVTENLTISPERECIIGRQAELIRVQQGGTLHIDGRITNGTHTTYSRNYWLISSYDNNDARATHASDQALVRIDQGGTLNWEGGYVMGRHAIAFEYTSDASRSSVRIRSGGFNCLQFFNTYPLMVRAYTNDLDVDGFAFVNGGAWCMFRPSVHEVKNLSFEHAYGIAWSGGSEDSVFHEIANYKSLNPAADSGFWSDVWQRWLNPEKGSDLIVVGLSANNASNTGLVEIVKQISIDIKNEDGDAVPDARIYIPDTDNGNRKDFGPNNYTDDRHAVLATGADGKATHDLLVAVAARASGGAQGTNDAGDNAKDYRSKNNSSDDVFDVHMIGYEYDYSLLTREMKGPDVLNMEQVLKVDDTITETDRETVAAYDSISNSAQLYDALKSWLVENYEGEPEPIVSRDGNKIITNNKSITFDPVAIDPVSYDKQTNTITVSSFDFTGDIDAGTGTVTLDSSQIEMILHGSYVDSTRDSAVTIIGVNLAPAANRLYVSTDDGATYTELDTDVYPYLSHPTDKVRFRYEKGDGESGDPIVTEDDYALSNSGIENEFVSFTNETGQLIQSQTNEIASILSQIETKMDAVAKQTALESASNRITDIFDGMFGSAVYDKASSVVSLFRGNDPSGIPFASFDMKDEDGNPSALNRFFSRIKRN